MVYITGDTHGDFKKLKRFCSRIRTSTQDIMIILGDSGLNYFTDIRAKRYKDEAARLPITLLCIHGNHEERASNIPTYHKEQFLGGTVLVEEQYPTLKFALDGEIYNIQNKFGNIKRALVIGGAYSVDKYYRIMNGANWYESEQPSDEIKSHVDKVIGLNRGNIDIVLAHTCPYRYIPREWFIGGIDQSTVDNSTELWLDTIYENLNRLENWYCGHFHGHKVIDNICFLFNEVVEL